MSPEQATGCFRMCRTSCKISLAHPGYASGKSATCVASMRRSDARVPPITTRQGPKAATSSAAPIARPGSVRRETRRCRPPAERSRQGCRRAGKPAMRSTPAATQSALRKSSLSALRGRKPDVCDIRISLKNSRLIQWCRADSILPMGGRIGDDGTAAGSATGAFLRVLAGRSRPPRITYSDPSTGSSIWAASVPI